MGEGFSTPLGSTPKTHTRLHPLYIKPTTGKLEETNTLSEAHGGKGRVSQNHSESQRLRFIDSSCHTILDL